MRDGEASYYWGKYLWQENFPEFSNEYSIKKANFTDIADHLDEIMQIREDIEFAEQHLCFKSKKI